MIKASMTNTLICPTARYNAGKLAKDIDRVRLWCDNVAHAYGGSIESLGATQPTLQAMPWAPPTALYLDILIKSGRICRPNGRKHRAR